MDKTKDWQQNVLLEGSLLTCELMSWALDNGWGMCNNGEPHNHHILPRSLLRNNKAATKLVEQTYGDFLMARVCPAHNAGDGNQRCADTPGARAFLIQKRVDEHGEDVIRTILDDVRLTYKSHSDRAALDLDAILSRG